MTLTLQEEDREEIRLVATQPRTDLANTRSIHCDGCDKDGAVVVLTTSAGKAFVCQKCLDEIYVPIDTSAELGFKAGVRAAAELIRIVNKDPTVGAVTGAIYEEVAALLLSEVG